jgi:hypothetical protein
MRGRLSRYLSLAVIGLAVAAAIAGCDTGSATLPAPTAVPPQPTFTPPPMASKIVLYGDLAKFGEKGAPDTCILKNRFTRGESVGFRMTAIDPMTGKFAETAKLVVHVTSGGKTTDIPMNYRGTGSNPRPGFWTAKWVVPTDAPTGIVEYTVTGTDDQGRTGEFKPFQVQPSELAVVEK